MSEELLYTVSVGRNSDYGGRDREGRLIFVPYGGGVFMSLACAEKLCNVLRPTYPNVRPVELMRGDRDEIPVQSLSELREDVGLEKLALVIQQCINQNFSNEQILATCKNAVEAARLRAGEI
jgi:hypothetical protein